MAFFTIYFCICFCALILRGYYRVPQSCIIEEVLNREENTVKSLISDREDCRCHYTNFFWKRLSPKIETNFTSFLNETIYPNGEDKTGDNDDDETSFVIGIVKQICLISRSSFHSYLFAIYLDIK